MSQRLTTLVGMLKDMLLGKAETEEAEVALDLLETAETLPEVDYVLSESGMGEIPNELLTESGFGEISGVWRAPKERKRKPPSTGRVARGRHSSRRVKALNASGCDHHNVIKAK